MNISSIAATTAVGSSVAYCAAKAGMDVMGAALARALAPAIRVLTVSPGVVDTRLRAGPRPCVERQDRRRDPAQAARPRPRTWPRAVLACATHLTFSTGSVIQVDGGRHL